MEGFGSPPEFRFDRGQTRPGLGRVAAADTLLFMAAGMVAGFVLLGAAVGRLIRLGVAPLAYAVACMVAFKRCRWQ